MLDSGTTIPATVANMLGRDAFCHSGLIPYIAEAVARYKPDALDSITAETVARHASSNTMALYPQLANLPDAANEPPEIDER